MYTITELPFYCEAKLTPLLNLDLDCETARQRLRKPKNVGTKIVEFANRFKSACVLKSLQDYCSSLLCAFGLGNNGGNWLKYPLLQLVDFSDSFMQINCNCDGPRWDAKKVKKIILAIETWRENPLM